VLVAAVLAVALTGSCSGGDGPDQAVQGATTLRTTTTRDPASVPARPSPGCRRESAAEVPKGETESAIDSGGETRTFFMRVPPAHDGTRPVPLVIDYHGFGEGSRLHTAFSGLPDLGMLEGFVTVTPQGAGTSAFWNTFGLSSPDDVAFTAALLDDLGDTLCIDLARVYAAGMSNGAFLTSLLACRLPDRFAAVAAVAGVQSPTPCRQSRPVPILAVHGTDDSFVRFSGGLGPGVQTLGVDPAVLLPHFDTRSVPAIMADWARRNRCIPGAEQDQVAPDVVRSAWQGCNDGAEVVLYAVRGGGHTWPGSEISKAGESLIGRTTMSVRANQIIWDFFRAHPMG
jgi:polyhydroxybutyrate depolymerase